ncbi:MAG: hypothetical protein HY698_17520 [Deltaproteobacteria bacterium]|nr:hypothetical protein [Deltaproteobacteria bacterium]
MRCLVSLLATLLFANTAAAESYRLRADVLSSATPPAGLVVLQGEEERRPWLRVEALVWATGREGEGNGDALVANVRLRDPKGRGELRLGRMLVTSTGRPLHVDGVSGWTRLRRWQTEVEAFAGMPVVPKLGVQSFDWALGARVAEPLGGFGTAGVSYLHRRTEGQLFDEEVGLDYAVSPRPWLDISARGSYDVVTPGVSEASLSAAARRGRARAELFAYRRSPSRMLPATSLFSALGDVPSDAIGTSLFLRAAPRLDLSAKAAFRTGGGQSGDASLRCVLRLDDRGDGAVSLEVRRQEAGKDSFTGARATGRLPLPYNLVASTELELVVPDDLRGRGAAWPWGLVALRARPFPLWEVAAAVEASASPENEAQVNALVRVARRFEP